METLKGLYAQSEKTVTRMKEQTFNENIGEVEYLFTHIDEKVSKKFISNEPIRIMTSVILISSMAFGCLNALTSIITSRPIVAVLVAIPATIFISNIEKDEVEGIDNFIAFVIAYVTTSAILNIMPLFAPISMVGFWLYHAYNIPPTESDVSSDMEYDGDMGYDGGTPHMHRDGSGGGMGFSGTPHMHRDGSFVGRYAG